MGKFWYVWVHRTDHLTLAFAAALSLVAGLVSGSWWWVMPFAATAVLDTLRTRQRQMSLRRLAEEGTTTMDTRPYIPADRE